MSDKRRYLFEAVLVILVLVAGYFGIKLPAPATPEPLPFTIIDDDASMGFGTRSAIGRAIQFDCNIRAAQDVHVVGDLGVNGTTTIDGTIEGSGALVVGTSATLPKIIQTLATTVTVTNGGTITTTGDIVPLTAGGNVGTATISLCETAGRVTTLWNTSATTITITETGNLKLSGNAALAQYDTLMLLGDGTNCIELAQTDN